MTTSDIATPTTVEPGARRQKIASGLVFLCVAVIALFQLRGISFGTGLQPGPAFFPVLLSSILAVLGLVNIVVGCREAAAIPLFAGWGRAVLLIPLAVLSFGLVVEPFGLVPAIVLCTALCGLAARRFRPIETLILCALLAAFGVGVFINGLGLPFTAFQE